MGDRARLMGVNIGAKVEKVNGKQLRYEDFVERYLKKNRPVVLTGLTDDWRASEEWITDEGRPNLRIFSTHFGKSTVQVADCSKREFSDQKRIEMTVSDFIDHWQTSSEDGSDILTCNGDTTVPFYLKDWHFAKEYPHYIAYLTPPLFIDDWLNMYLDSFHMHGSMEHSDNKYDVNCSDYRFVYMGTKGTWTPLHADVFRSYSWSANICGRKLWLLLPPEQCHLLFDKHLKRSVYDIFANVADEKFPGFKETVWWECVQEKDEIIFVPSGWYHQVHNLEDTISINHNWFNGYNLSWVWKLLVRDYEEAKEYIEDVREISDDFEGLCQRNLAANTGMNYYDFFIFMLRFSLANLIHLCGLGVGAQDEDSIILPPSGVGSLVWNVMVIRHISLKMLEAEAFAPENLQRYSIENPLVLFDLHNIFVEQKFSKLCEAVARTSGIASNPSASRATSGCLKMEDLAKSYLGEVGGIGIFGPKALVSLIDLVLKDLFGVHQSSQSTLQAELENLNVSTVL